MNSFYEQHKDSIRFHYPCFDRILLNGLIQPFQQPERVVGFFDTYRQLYPVSRDTLRGIADRFTIGPKLDDYVLADVGRPLLLRAPIFRRSWPSPIFFAIAERTAA